MATPKQITSPGFKYEEIMLIILSMNDDNFRGTAVRCSNALNG